MLLLYHMYGSIEVMAYQFVIGCLSWTQKDDSSSLWIDHCAYIGTIVY